jgi:hypothetical protein
MADFITSNRVKLLMRLWSLPSAVHRIALVSSDLPPLPSMARDDVLLPQLHFPTLIFPQSMQYHASHAMTGLEEGRDSSVGWTWLDDVLDGCGIEVGGGGVDTALPQV